MRARRKERARGLLRDRDLEGLAKWSDGANGALSTLYSITNDPDELMVWRAVEAVGIAAGRKWAGRPESVRDFIRRLLWLMNDESGGLGWHAPESVAEIIHAIPDLAGEFGRLLPAYLVEEPFERGTHYALSRVGRLIKPELAASLGTLERSLSDPDPYVRHYTLKALAHLGNDVLAEARAALVGDVALVRVYDFDSGTLVETEAGAPARTR